MLKTKLVQLILLISFSCSLAPDEESKSFSPGDLWLDTDGVPINAHGGGILFHNNKYYWYGEHKVEGEAGNKAHVGVRVYSSSDLYQWKNEGIALEVVANDTLHDLAKGCIIERPKVIYNPKSEEFVMWFHLELKDKGYRASRSGIAVSKTAEGPFEYLGSFRPNAGHWPINVKPYHKQEVSDAVRSSYCGGVGCLPQHPDTLNLLGRDFANGQMARDMTLFVDDDGKAYHIYSSEENSTLHISELTSDYRTYSGKYARFFSNRYMEAPALFKAKDDKYYLIASGCTGWAPNAARLAVADNIWGPWEELGNPCVGVDADSTFHSQSTFVLPVNGEKSKLIFMADRWNPENAIDGRYVWLPITFEQGRPVIKWKDQWDLSVFK